MARAWKREEVLQLLDLYFENKNLWGTKSNDYKKRQENNFSGKNNYSPKSFPSWYNLQSCEEKKNSLGSRYSKEVKIRGISKVGAGTEDFSKPALFVKIFYKPALFEKIFHFLHPFSLTPTHLVHIPEW